MKTLIILSIAILALFILYLLKPKAIRNKDKITIAQTQNTNNPEIGVRVLTFRIRPQMSGK